MSMGPAGRIREFKGQEISSLLLGFAKLKYIDYELLQVSVPSTCEDVLGLSSLVPLITRC